MQGNIIHQKNLELFKKVNLTQEENTQLCRKVYGISEMEATSRNRFLLIPYGIQVGGGGSQALVQLQLCQPEQEACKTSASATK
ncbi:hypothetical protein HN51_043812 [Arachis hypogaea]